MKGFIRSRRGKYGGVSVALTVLTLVAVIIFNIILSVLATRYEWMYANMNSNTVFSVSENCESYLAEHVFPRVDEINKNLTDLGEEKQKIKIVFCEDKDSILNHYSKLINVRTRYKAIARGNYTAFTTSDKNIAGFIVEYEGEYLFIVHNNSAGEISIDLSTVKSLEGYDISKLCEYLGENASLKGTTLKIGGYTSAILM